MTLSMHMRTRQFKNNDDDAKNYRAAMKESGPYLTLGIQLAFSIAAFCGIGYWLDKANGTSHWLGIMAGAGAVLSLVYFIVTVLKLSAKEETKSAKK
jgi:F0F1-type ATP synthase assembly protein I